MPISWLAVMAARATGGSRKVLRRELSILERSFPRHGDHCFRVVLASPEELVCRFVHQDNTYNLQCSISVSLSSTIERKSSRANKMILSLYIQPNYPVVMPIWITECADKFIVDLVAELNVADQDAHAATPSQAPASTHSHLVKFYHVNFVWSRYHTSFLNCLVCTVYV